MRRLWARLCCGGGSKPNSPGITSSSASSHLPPSPPQYNPTPKTTQEPAPSTPEPPRPAVIPASSHIGKPNSPEITSSSASSHLPPSPSPSPPPPPQYSPMPETTQEPAQSTPDLPRPSVLQKSSQIEQILDKPHVELNQIYDLDKELRRGEFGITYLCTEKSTGLKYACKSISRRKLVTEKDIEDVRREIAILEHLSGQPNIVEFKGAYEDRSNLHLVMELCSGGELFDRITAKGSYSEKEAARIGRQVVNVVHVCHFLGVMHRDLKPENFLMVSREEDASLKATDFGLSVFIEEG